MLLGDLQSKDVINVVDGSKLGRISNLEIDP
ncbi:MAG: YlmC/YmxH family sporulation protein, partial [Acholeplasmataceae bacterium]|nr:YlmC/YmxH family sporulation protein [Acholeplasmataceae bacterium]